MVRNSQTQTQKLFLTYQHLERVPEYTLADLNSYLTSLPNVKSVTVGQENYPSEPGFHVHCLIVFSLRVTFETSRLTYHAIVPFSQQFRGRGKAELLRVHEYCIKDGVFLDSFEVEEDKGEGWRNIAASNTKEEALEIFNTSYPRDAILQRRNFDYWCSQKFAVLEAPYVAGAEVFNVPDVVSRWCEDQLPGKHFFFFFITYRLLPP